METKICEQCGEVFPRPKERTHAAWRARKYCGHSCSIKSRTKFGTSKRCIQCGKVFYRDRFRTNEAWKARKFCSQSCSSYSQSAAASARMKAWVGENSPNWKHGKLSGKGVHDWLYR